MGVKDRLERERAQKRARMAERAEKRGDLRVVNDGNNKRRPATEGQFFALKLIGTRAQIGELQNQLLQKDVEIFELRKQIAMLRRQIVAVENQLTLTEAGIRPSANLRISRDEESGDYFWVDAPDPPTSVPETPAVPDGEVEEQVAEVPAAE